jgi:tetratricopeptide (TPR) repeat protein
MDRFSKIAKMLENDPEDSFLQFALAKEYEKKQIVEDAIKIYQNLLKKDPEYVGAYYHLGKALEQLKQFQEALNIYELGIIKASTQKDFLSLSELNSAKENLQLELED